MITVNGEPREGFDGVLLSEFLGRAGYETGRIAVEINGEIISKARWEEVFVKAGDHIEVVSFVGGG